MELPYIEEELDSLLDQSAKFVMELKYKYNRPRPYQIAEFYGIDLNGLELDTMKTPSYPSGHSVQSRLVAEYYIRKYPQHKKGLIAAAEECGQGRVKAGWHFPSDHKVGVMIAVEIAPMVEL